MRDMDAVWSRGVEQECHPQKPDSTEKCDAGVVAEPGPTAEVPDTKERKRTNNKNGCGGLKGNEYQINLLVAILLKAILLKPSGKIGDWKLSTEDKVLDKFDDAVLQSQGKYILIQAKNKETATKLITYEKLLSLTAKGPLYLMQYYLSWQKLKNEHIKKNIKNVIICTNAGIKIGDKNLNRIMNKEEVSTEHLLYFENCENVCYTFKKEALEALKKQIRSHKGEEFVFDDDDMRRFLSILQIFPNFLPDDSSPGGFLAIGREVISQISLAKNLEPTSAVLDIRDKVIKMYKGKKKELDAFRAEAYFCEIISSNYCKDCCNYFNVKWENNELHSIFEQPDIRVFHVIVPQQSHLMLYVIKVFQALHNPLKNSNYLFLNPNESIEVQRAIIQAFFKVPMYIFLVILLPLYDNEELVELLCSVTESKKFKKVIVIGKLDNALLNKINKEKRQKELKLDLSICELSAPITFNTLSSATQQNLLNRIIVFQGIPMSLEKMLASGAGHIDPLTDINHILDGEILARLTKTDENIQIWRELKHSERNIENYYIHRTFFRDKQTYSEEELWQNGEKLVLISDVAGMGKSTVLGSLSVRIKKNFPHSWVIRIDLNRYTEILSRCIKKEIKLTELLQSQVATELKTEFERRLFEVKDKVVLMVDAMDEISPNYFDIVLHLLQDCRSGYNIDRIFVTTRPNLCKNLEEELNITSYILEQYLESDQVDFLTKYWIEHLHLREENEKQKRCVNYAQRLIKEMSVMLQDDAESRKFAGIPLQTRMLAEVFQENNREADSAFKDWEGCKEFLDSDKEEPSVSKKINLNELYTMFIDKKRDIFLDKGDARGHPLVVRSMTEMFNNCHQCHQVLALQVAFPPHICELFNVYQNKEELLLSTKDYLPKAGILVPVDGKRQFIHRTFAEYYVAECLLLELKSETQNEQFKKFFLTDIVLSEEYYVIRAFLDGFIKAELYSLPHAALDIARYAVEKFGSIHNIKSSFMRLTPLHIAAEEGCLYLMKLLVGQLVESKVIINDTKWAYYSDASAIYSAAEEGHLNVVKFLFNYYKLQQDCRNTDFSVGKAILFAAKEGHLNVVKFFIEQDTENIERVPYIGFNACYHAALYGHLNVVKFLFENFRHTDWVYRRNVYVSSRTMLHSTANNGHLDVVKFLLQLTDVKRLNIKDVYGNTPLHLAANSGNLQVVKAFIEQFKDTKWIHIRDKGGNTVLHIATLKGNLDMVRFLMEQLAEVKWFNIKNIEGHTALHYAANECKLDIVKYFIEQLTDINWVNIKDYEGRTALHVSVGTSDNLPVIKFLLEQLGASNWIDIKDNKGGTALHTAAVIGNLQVVECFMKYLGKTNWIDIKDSKGYTVLHSAATSGNVQLVRGLVEQLADTKSSWIDITDNKGCTALHAAASNGEVEMVKFFIQKLTDTKWIDIKDNKGNTALHAAAFNGELETVKFLILQLRDTSWIDIKDNGSLTALHAAAQRGQVQIVYFLLGQYESRFSNSLRSMKPFSIMVTDGVIQKFDFRSIELNNDELLDAINKIKIIVRNCHAWGLSERQHFHRLHEVPYTLAQGDQ